MYPLVTLIIDIIVYFAYRCFYFKNLIYFINKRIEIKKFSLRGIRKIEK